MLVMRMRRFASGQPILAAVQHPLTFRSQALTTHKGDRRRQFNAPACIRSEKPKAMLSKQEAAPTLSLCAVALLWATFGPCLRVIYAEDGMLLSCLFCLR
jgi:hypothetical protein